MIVITIFFKSRILHDNYHYHKFLNYSKLSNPTEEGFIQIFESFLKNHFTINQNDTIGDQLAMMDYREVIDFIDTNFFNAISLQKLAKMKDISTFSFIRNFKKVKGITPAQYIILRRVEDSKKKLRQGNSIIDSALSAGFYDQSHMSRNFKKITGITPRMYQKACNIVQE